MSVSFSGASAASVTDTSTAVVECSGDVHDFTVNHDAPDSPAPDSPAPDHERMRPSGSVRISAVPSEKVTENIKAMQTTPESRYIFHQDDLIIRCWNMVLIPFL